MHKTKGKAGIREVESHTLLELFIITSRVLEQRKVAKVKTKKKRVFKRQINLKVWKTVQDSNSQLSECI